MAENRDKNIFFSIVIPSYNRADLILETLESVFAQTYAHYEILVVDNCSTDNTEEILKPLIEKNKIRFIKNERNYERAYSRNIGLKNAAGDFLTLLDSDDFLLPNCLQDACDFVLNNPEIKVFHNFSTLVNDKHQLVYRLKYPSIKNQYKAICRGNFMGAIGGFIAREAYQQFRLNEDPKMTGAEDYEFWFNVFARYKVGRIYKVNSQIREHPARSVNIDAYNHLTYQRDKMIETINSNKFLKEKYGKYTGTLAASFELQDVIVNKQSYTLRKRLSFLVKAAKSDFSVIFTKRFISVMLNIFKN
jgi:glycosyltransferase involved in cell wall biosynthesis